MRRHHYLFNSKNDLHKLSVKDFFRFLQRIKFSPLMWFVSITVSILVPVITNGATYFVGYIIDSRFTHIDFVNFDYKTFAILIFLLSLMYILHKCLKIAQNRIFYSAVLKLSYELLLESYLKIQKMPISYFDSKKTGDIMSLLTNDIVNITQALLNFFSEMINITLEFTFVFVLMFIYSPILASVAIGLMLISLTIMYLIIRKNQRFFIQQQYAFGDFQGYLEEVFDAFALIRLTKQQEKISKNFDAYNKALVKPNLKSAKRNILTYPLSQFMKHINILIIIALGSYLILNNINSGGIQQLTPGLLVTFTIYINNVSNTIIQILDLISSVQQGLSSIYRLQQLLNQKLPVNQDELNELDYKQGLVEFRDVAFGYNGSTTELAVENINFKILPGQTVALVGHTGSGKTTIAKLLAKFYVPTKGQIFIDEQEVQSIKDDSWRKHIDMVLQDTYIFNATLRDNLRLFNENITDEEIYNKVDQITGRSFIDPMPQQLDTMLESNASNLSHGQKQLISIIRSLISNHPITILDEATSSIDTITEAQIQKTMDFLIENRSCLIIAHRLSTIVNADLILVVDHGKIIERGTHSELMELNGKYAQLYKIGFKETLSENGSN
ncbi:ABC transporter ATP-binding protein [Mycoplasmopsis columbinasalis]|uniref:ABC-type multidrug/protein/lipid transport system ATPase component n=1 Tax=Mycoplasmopsis columbinasalis TaxID=114880 RepID=A0A449B9Y6_9BACT|nr:ABC transporter ATP-binding protein [Mycoplasmopsis columbinasalis]VEU78001.1 ABC-type multidrug/protein/lipid transport system ATPase component [Mycoplasmopsis columbinasalis]